MKNLLLIGNKPYEEFDKADEVKDFDFVVRVNRMTNYGVTGTRLDGHYLGMYDDFRNVYHGGEYAEMIKTAQQIFCPQLVKDNTEHIFDYITKEQYDGIEVVDIGERPRNEMNCHYPTSTLFMLRHLLRTPKWKDEYDIYITGIDIEGRGNLMSNGEAWINTRHRYCGYAEEEWLKWRIKQGEIKVL